MLRQARVLAGARGRCTAGNFPRCRREKSLAGGGGGGTEGLAGRALAARRGLVQDTVQDTVQYSIVLYCTALYRTCTVPFEGYCTILQMPEWGRAHAGHVWAEMMEASDLRRLY